MAPVSPFSKKVIALIKKIPSGKVATYGQIARLAGNPLGSRGVVWILHSLSASQDLPWHRVINSKGKISFPTMSAEFLRQSSLLQREGVLFSAGDVVDLESYLWKKN